MTATLLIGVLAVALSPQQTDTTFNVAANARIDIETFGGEINVKTWSRNAVRVQATHGRRDVIDISARGSSVSIEAEGRVGPAHSVVFNVTVPTAATLSLSGVYTQIDVEGVTGDVDAETVEGNIRVIGGGRLKLESVQGSIIVDKARGRVSVNTVNQGIRVSNTVGDVDAETVNGPIILHGVQATNVDLATVNGRIVYDGTLRDGGDYAIASHNGAIWVVVPEKSGATVSVSTFNGEMDASFPVSIREQSSKRSYNFVIGSGSARIDLESFGGDIHLRRPGEPIPTTMEAGGKVKTKSKVEVR